MLDRHLPRARRLLAFVLAVALAAVGCVSGREPERASAPAARVTPDHEAWSRHLEASRRAADSGNPDEAQAAALQVYAESLRFSEADRRLVETYQVIEQVIRALTADGGPEHALPLLRGMAERASELGVPLHPMAIHVRSVLVRFLVRSGRYAEAEAAAAALHREAMQAFGPDHIQSARSLHNLAGVVAMRDNGRALELLEGYVEGARRALGPTSPEVVALLSALGHSQFQEARFDEAESTWMAALEGAKGAGPLAAQVAPIECELGRLASARDDLDSAERHFDSCRAIYEANFGEKNAALVDALLMLAGLQYARGDLEASYRYAERARAIALANVGPNDPLLVYSLTAMATVLIEVGQEAAAAGLVDQAAQIVEQHHHPDGSALCALGNVEHRLGRSEQGIEHLEGALEWVAERRGERSLATASALNNLAYALARDGQGERAVTLARRAGEIVTGLRGADNSSYARVLDTLGVALTTSGEPAEGLEHIDASIALVRRLHGDRAGPLLEMNTQRTAALRALGRIEESEKLLQSIALDRRERGSRLGEAADPSVPLVFAESNFRLSVPGPPWVVFPPGTMELEADITLMRTDPNVFFSVFTYTPDDPAPGLDEWMRKDEEGLRAHGRRLQIVSRDPVTIAGIPGQRVRISAVGPKATEHHDRWYGIHNGFYYVIRGTSLARESSPETLWENTELLLSGFELIDPARRFRPPESGFVFHSDRFGYSIDLAGLPWHREPGKNDIEHAEFGAAREGASIVTLPVSRLGLDIDDETLARALLASIGFEEPDSFESLDGQGLEGLEYRFERKRDYGIQKYRVRVVRRGDVACLVSAAAPADIPDLENALAVVERFRWEGEPAILEMSSLDEPERVRHRRVFDRVAAKYVAARQYARGIEVMKLRLGLYPEDAKFRALLARYELAIGRYKDAIETIEPAIAEFPERPDAWIVQAQAKHRLEGAEPAIPSYRRAFELGYEDESALGDFVEALWEANQRDEAFERLDTAIAATGSRELRAKRASLYRQSARLDEATAELVELEAAAPGNVDVLLELALVHTESARYRQAIEACDRLLEQLPQSWAVLYLKAQAQTAAGLLTDAKSTIDRAAELSPDSQEVSELQALVTAALGRGSTEGARSPVPAVFAPQSLLVGVPAEPPEDAAAFGAYYAYWSEAVRFGGGTPFRRTTRFRVTILGTRGLEQFSSLRFEFNPLGERIFVNEVTVYDAAGKVVAEGDISEQYVTDAESSRQASSTKMLNVPVPGLSIGSSVEMSVTRENTQSPERFTYSDFIFSRTIPIHRFVVYVEGPVGELADHATGAVRRRSGEGWFAWVAENPEPYRWEPLQSPGLEHLPRLRIGEARNSWEGLAREYLADIEDRLSPAESIPALVDEATGAASGSQERVQSLAGFTQTALRYEPISFGPRARIPKTIEQTLRDRYGDCKDHSLLLLQLLRQAGFQASLALVSVSGKIDPEVPSLDQFDHMVVRCGDCPGAVFIDATDKHVALGRSSPRALSGKLALILDAETPKLEKIPNADPGEFTVRIDRRAQLSDEGALAVREEVMLEGHVAASIRATLRSIDHVSWEENLKRKILDDRKKVAVSAIEIENVERVDAPLKVSLEYEVEDAFTPTSDGMLGSLPAGWERALLSADRVDGRVSPFEIQEPLQISETVRLGVPSGYSARIAGSGERESSSPFLDWQVRDELLSDGLLIRFAASLSRGTFPADQYEAYFDAVTRALGFFDRPVEIRRAVFE